MSDNSSMSLEEKTILVFDELTTRLKDLTNYTLELERQHEQLRAQVHARKRSNVPCTVSDQFATWQESASANKIDDFNAVDMPDEKVSKSRDDKSSIPSKKEVSEAATPPQKNEQTSKGTPVEMFFDKYKTQGFTYTTHGLNLLNTFKRLAHFLQVNEYKCEERQEFWSAMVKEADSLVCPIKDKNGVVVERYAMFMEMLGCESELFFDVRSNNFF